MKYQPGEGGEIYRERLKEELGGFEKGQKHTFESLEDMKQMLRGHLMLAWEWACQVTRDITGDHMILFSYPIKAPSLEVYDNIGTLIDAMKNKLEKPRPECCKTGKMYYVFADGEWKLPAREGDIIKDNHYVSFHFCQWCGAELTKIK